MSHRHPTHPIHYIQSEEKHDRTVVLKCQTILQNHFTMWLRFEPPHDRYSATRKHWPVNYGRWSILLRAATTRGLLLGHESLVYLLPVQPEQSLPPPPLDRRHRP